MVRLLDRGRSGWVTSIPETRAQLTYDAERQELVSKAAHLAYPIRNGIPIMLADEARKLD